MQILRRRLHENLASLLISKTANEKNSQVEKLLSTLGLPSFQAMSDRQELTNCIQLAQSGNLEALEKGLQTLSQQTRSLPKEEMMAVAGLLASVAPKEFQARVPNVVVWALEADTFEENAFRTYAPDSKVEYSEPSWSNRDTTLGFDIRDSSGESSAAFWSVVESEINAALRDSFKKPPNVEQTVQKLIEALKTKRGTDLRQEFSSILSPSQQDSSKFLFELAKNLQPEMTYDVLFDDSTLQQLEEISGGAKGVGAAAEAFISCRLQGDDRKKCVKLLQEQPTLREFFTAVRSELPYGVARVSSAALNLLQDFLAFGNANVKAPIRKPFELFHFARKPGVASKLEELLSNPNALGIEDWALHVAERFSKRQELKNVGIPLGKPTPLRLTEWENQLENPKLLETISPWLWTLQLPNNSLSDEEVKQKEAILSFLVRNQYKENGQFLQKLDEFSRSSMPDDLALFKTREESSRNVAERLANGNLELLEDKRPLRSGIEKLAANQLLVTKQEVLQAVRFLHRESLKNKSIASVFVRKLNQSLERLPASAVADILKEWQRLDEREAVKEPGGLLHANASLALKYQFVSQLNLYPLEIAFVRELTPQQKNQLRQISTWALVDSQVLSRKKFTPSQKRAWEHDLLPGVSDETKARFLRLLKEFEVPSQQEAKKSDDPLLTIRVLKSLETGNLSSLLKHVEKDVLPGLPPQDRIRFLQDLISTPGPSNSTEEQRTQELQWLHALSLKLDQERAAASAEVLLASKTQELTEREMNALSAVGNKRINAAISNGFGGLHAASLEAIIRSTIEHLHLTSASPAEYQEAVTLVSKHFLNAVACFSQGILTDEELAKFAKDKHVSIDELLICAQEFASEKYQERLSENFNVGPQEDGNIRVFVDKPFAEFHKKLFLRHMLKGVLIWTDENTINKILDRKTAESTWQQPISLSERPAELKKLGAFLERDVPALLEPKVISIEQQKRLKSVPPSSDKLNFGNLARFMKSPAALELHVTRFETLSESYLLADGTPFLARFVHQNFERMYLRACALNDGKETSLEEMKTLRRECLQECKVALEDYHSWLSTAGANGAVDLTALRVLEEKMAHAMVRAFTQNGFQASAEKLIRPESHQNFEGKISLHEIPLTGEAGVVERLLRTIKIAQERLPAEKQLHPRSFEILRAANRVSGGSFGRESKLLQDWASQTENLTWAMDAKLYRALKNQSASAFIPNVILEAMVQQLRELTSSILQGKNDGGEDEAQQVISSHHLPILHVKNEGYQVDYTLSVPGRQAAIHVVSHSSKTLENERVRDELAKIPRELQGLTRSFVVAPSHSSSAFAHAEYRSRTIEILPSAFEDGPSLSFILLHEIGHLVSARLWGKAVYDSLQLKDWGMSASTQNAALKRWCDVVEKDAIFESRYGTTDPAESFSQRFAMYYESLKAPARHALLRRMYPNSFALLDEVRRDLVRDLDALPSSSGDTAKEKVSWI